MTARKDDRDDRRDAGHDGVTYDGAVYDGMDALMAALTDDPVPEEALRDPDFVTAHRAAAADVAVLREQLTLIGETLARGGEAAADAGAEAGDAACAGRGTATQPEAATRPRPEAGPGTASASPVRPVSASEAELGAGSAAPEVSGLGSEAEAGVGPVSPVRPVSPSEAVVRAASASAPGDGSGSEVELGAAAAASSMTFSPTADAEPRTASAAPVTPMAEPGAEDDTGPRSPVRSVPARAPRRSRRPLAVVVGALAAAAAAGMVVGLGWLVVQAGSGTHDTASGSSADTSAEEAYGGGFGSARYLVCARVVAEGTVVAVEPLPGGVQDRVTLEVSRSYQPEKPVKGTDEVTFVREEGVHPRLHEGDKALVGLPRGGALPDALFVTQKDIARERAWILRELPKARELSCE
ncbi:hypothetical protein GCM10027074_09000 [Streptomyces deserti]